MSKKIILFPNLSKKYFLPFGIALFQIILINVNKYYPDNNKNTCLELFSSSLGFMLIRILPCLFKISHSNQERRHKKKKNMYILYNINNYSIIYHFYDGSFRKFE